MSDKGVSLLPQLRITVDQLIHEFDQIEEDRRKLLKELSNFVREKLVVEEKVFLNFICTHNSRRSHIAQLWAQTAAHHFDIANVECFSGGTEVTAFNPRAVKAMQDVGFNITKISGGDNPNYEVRFSTDAPSIISFSKKYDGPFNQAKNFAAIMTCSHADENCPLVSGASTRIAITYDDPKDFDETLLEEAKYNERVRQIGREMLFAFSLLKK